MAINRDPAEWFERFDVWGNETYGIVKKTDTWLVLKKYDYFGTTKVEVVTEVDSRNAAIGFVKLLAKGEMK
jgi:hypothetical protein